VQDTIHKNSITLLQNKVKIKQVTCDKYKTNAKVKGYAPVVYNYIFTLSKG